MNKRLESAEHSPLPWRVSHQKGSVSYQIFGKVGVIADLSTVKSLAVSREETIANADLIVEAVNSYASNKKLIGELLETLNQLDNAIALVWTTKENLSEGQRAVLKDAYRQLLASLTLAKKEGF